MKSLLRLFFDDFPALVIAAVAAHLVGKFILAALRTGRQCGGVQLPDIRAAFVAPRFGNLSLWYRHVVAPPPAMIQGPRGGKARPQKPAVLKMPHAHDRWFHACKSTVFGWHGTKGRRSRPRLPYHYIEGNPICQGWAGVFAEKNNHFSVFHAHGAGNRQKSPAFWTFRKIFRQKSRKGLDNRGNSLYTDKALERGVTLPRQGV